MNLGFAVLTILILVVPIFYQYFIKKGQPVEKNTEDKNKKIKCPRCGFENASVMKYCAKCNSSLEVDDIKNKREVNDTVKKVFVLLVLPYAGLYFFIIKPWIIKIGGIWGLLLNTFSIPIGAFLFAFLVFGTPYVFKMLFKK